MSCFVNKNITGGLDNVASTLNEDLVKIFPDKVDLKKGVSQFYLDVLSEKGEFKNSFPVDWETEEGQKYINENHPGVLGENGEPKLYVNKVGLAYFKKADGFIKLNSANISENERFESIKALMASYVEANLEDLRSFILNSSKRNIGVNNSIILKLSDNRDSLRTLARKKGVLPNEKASISKKIMAIGRKIQEIKDNQSFLRSVVRNEGLLEIMYHDVKIALDNSKILYIEDIHERENNDASASIELGHLSPSNETNPMNNIPAEILNIMSTISKKTTSYNEDGEKEGKEDLKTELMPLLSYRHDYSDVFKEVQKVLNNLFAARVNFTPQEVAGLKGDDLAKYKKSLHNTNLYNVMISKLSDYASKTDSDIVGEFVSKIEALVESKKTLADKNNIKAKFAKSFHKAKSSNVMHTSSFGRLAFGENEDSPMTNLNKIDISDEESRVKRLTGEMITRAFMKLNSSYTEADEASITKAERKAVNGSTFYEKRNGLKTYLYKMYGMVLTDNTVSNLLREISKNPTPKEGMSKVEEFLDRIYYMTELGYNKSEVIERGEKRNKKLKKEYTIDSLAQDFVKASSAEKDGIIDNFAVNGGSETAIGLISRLEYDNSPSSADSSSSFGSKKVWLYSFMSKLQRDVIRWKNGDVSELENLKDTGNGLVDYLLAKTKNGKYDTRESQKRIEKISIKNNMELRQTMDSNPTMFDELSEEDLMILVFSNLYENRKENYVQREQGGNDQIGGSRVLKEMMENKATAGEYINLMNADKSSTNSFSGILRGDSDAVLDEGGNVTSIGGYAINRVKELFNGELNKMEKAQKIINQYLEIRDEDGDVEKTKEMKLSFAMRNLIPGWHYLETKDKDFTDPNQVISIDEFNNGKYLKFGFLNGFYNEHKDQIDRFFFDNPKEGFVKTVFAGRSELSRDKIDISKMMDEYFSTEVNKEVVGLKELTGSSPRSEYNDEWGVYDETPRKSLFEIQTNVIHEGYEIDASRAAANFSLNYMFHSMDMFNLLNGEVGMYGQKGDLFSLSEPLKRTSAINADGLYPINLDPEAVDYYLPFGEKEMFINGKRNEKAISFFKSSKTTFAVIDAQEYDDSFYSDSIRKIIHQNNKMNVITLKGEVADGQSYSHPQMLFNFYERVYGVSEKEAILHKELMDRNTVPTKEHFDFLRKLGGSNQGSKLQSFAMLKNESGTVIPFFWKSSVIPLYESLTKGFPIDQLRIAMEAQNVGVVANQSAIKSATHKATNVFNENSKENLLGSIKSSDKIHLNPFEVDTDDLKIQVELKSKGEHETVAGIQLLRNVIANMNLDSDEKTYFHEGKYVTAKQMLASYDSNIKDIVQLELNVFLKKINYKGPNNFDVSLFRKLITAQLGDLDYDVKEILEDINMPLETVPGMSSRIFPIISSYILKQVAKPKTNGAAMIQVATSGFNSQEISKTNSILFNENTHLKPPRPTTYEDHVKRLRNDASSAELIAEFDAKIEAYNESVSVKNKFDKKTSLIYYAEDSNNPEQISFVKKEGYQGRIEDGQIMIPFSSLFEKSKMSWEEFSKLAQKRDENGNLIGIDQEILRNIMGYRIPNQSMSSNDSFEIVGILAPSVGDSAIIYHEITAKTGSDFDIDKMTLMLPYFKTFYSFVSESSLSKENKAVLYKSISENRVHELMNTYKYQSIKDVLTVLRKNDGFEKYFKKQKLNSKDENQIVESLIFNRDEIEDFFEIDERKGVTYRRKDYSLKDVLNDFYEAEGKQSKTIDKDLKEAGFQPRKRIVADKFEYINDSSKKGLQNKLIRTMSNILRSATTYDDLISPLDGTHIKSSINKIRYVYALASEGKQKEIEELEELLSYKEDVIKLKSDLSVDKDNEGLKKNIKVAEAKVKKGEGLINDYLKSVSKSLISSMMPGYLVKSRTDMLMAKGLTATMANHMTNIPLTQINKVFLKYNIGLGMNSMSRTHVIGKEHLDDFKITKMVSYLMNASVDAAKDNYIIEGNYNRYSSGAAMLFVRLGMDPEDVSKIMLHPLIVKLSKEKLGSVSKIADIRASYSQEKLDGFSTKLLERINDKDVPFKITPDAFVQNIIDGANQSASSKNALSDEDILGFWSLSVKIGKDLNDLIKLSKPDSNGFGKNSSEAHAISNLHDIANGNSFAYYNQDGEIIPGGFVNSKPSESIHPFTTDGQVRYDDEGNYVSGMGGSHIAATSNIAISLVDELTNGQLIERSKGFVSLLNKIMVNIGKGYSTSQDNIKNIANNLYPYVLSTSGHTIYNFNDEDVKDMLETLPKDILKLKGDEMYAGNKFLSEISVDEVRGFISFNNTSAYSDLTKISIKDSSNSLYKNEATKKIMERLVKYCYFTTGFKPSSYSFVNYLPKQYFVESGHGEAIKKLLSDLNTAPESYIIKNIEKAMLFMATNRPKDDFIYKHLDAKKYNVTPNVPITSEGLLKQVSYTDPDTGEHRYHPFISVTKRDLTINFALISVDKDVPKYSKINAMHYTSKADFNKKESVSDSSERELAEYRELSDENKFDNDKYTQKTRKVTRKGKANRLVLFNPSLANNDVVFVDNEKASLYIDKTDFNLFIKRQSIMLNAELVDEFSKPPVKKEATESDVKADVDMNFKSNDDVSKYLKKSIDENILLSPMELNELRENIDYFYSQDKNAYFKQKAINLLQQKQGCN